MRRILLGVVVIAVLVGSGGYAYAQTRDSAPTYRTATATLADVQHTLDLSGTVSATGRRDLSFGAAGTVRSVSARLGQHVRRGQVLARLDPTSLDAQVTSAVASLAKAEAQLDSDETAQDDAATATATAAKAAKAAKSAKAKAKKQAALAAHQAAQQAAAQAAQQAATLAVLKKQQAAVTSAQTDAGHAMSDAQAALGTEQQACGTTGAGSGAGTQACADAVAAVEAAQATVAAKQQALQTAIETLSKTVAGSSAKGSSHGTGSGTTSGFSGKGGGSGGGTSTGSSSSGGFGKTVTAATLAQDQAQIDTAQGNLSQARAARGYATLRAPYAGQVVQSDLARQDVVSAGTTAFVLVGRGVTEVSTTLTSSQVAEVHAGQQVSVTPAGWSQALTGTVTLVGLLADSSGNHTLTVTVQSSRTVAEGSTASLSIVVGTARNAVTVPTSAVDRLGSRATVEVLHRKTVTRTLVTPGVVGSTRTSIASGLQAGTTVVLADLTAALPSSSSTTTGNRFGGAGLGGGFGGGLGGGGGFGGPGTFTVRRQNG